MLTLAIRLRIALPLGSEVGGIPFLQLLRNPYGFGKKISLFPLPVALVRGLNAIIFFA